MKHMQILQAEFETSEIPVEVIEPQCVVIAGNASEELKMRSQRRSFDLFRNELRNIRVITFDELFTRLSGLIEIVSGNSRT